MLETKCWVIRVNTADLHYQATIGPYTAKPSEASLKIYRKKYKTCACCGEPLTVVAAEGELVSNQFYRTVV